MHTRIYQLNVEMKSTGLKLLFPDNPFQLRYLDSRRLPDFKKSLADFRQAFTSFMDLKKVYFNSGDIKQYLSGFLENSICDSVRAKVVGDSEQAARGYWREVKQSCDQEVGGTLSYGYLTSLITVLNSITTFANTADSSLNIESLMKTYFDNLQILAATQDSLSQMDGYLRDILQRLMGKILTACYLTCGACVFLIGAFIYFDQRQYLSTLKQE